MKILYECSIIFILLPLAACSPATAVTTQPISAPQATDTVVPPPTAHTHLHTSYIDCGSEGRGIFKWGDR